jgi:rhodanese-related sulfurtransferase
MMPRTAYSTHRRLATAAAALALLAPFAGSPFAARHGAVDVDLLAGTVAREEDHITALELAQWIRERRPGLRIVDVRDAADFDIYHVPGAERMAIDSIAAVPFRADETIVLYSEGGAHAAQAWVFLRALGYKRVFFLRGGLYEWLEQVMNPALSADTSAAARLESGRVAALSRYFGGVPRRAAPGETLPVPSLSRDSLSTTAVLARGIRRRGC